MGLHWVEVSAVEMGWGQRCWSGLGSLVQGEGD